MNQKRRIQFCLGSNRRFHLVDITRWTYTWCSTAVLEGLRTQGTATRLNPTIFPGKSKPSNIRHGGTPASCRIPNLAGFGYLILRHVRIGLASGKGIILCASLRMARWIGNALGAPLVRPAWGIQGQVLAVKLLEVS